MKTKNLTKNKNLDEKEENSRGFFMPERATLGALSCQKEQGSSVFPQGFFLSEGGLMNRVYISPAIRSVWFLKGSGWHIKKQTGPVYHYRKEPDWKKRIIMAVVVILTLLICVGIARAEETAIETIARESSNQPFAAQVAVAEVIKTRMVERKQTAKQVCLAKWQFSCWNKGVRQAPRTRAELATARRAWEAAKATGVNLYHDNSVRPSWAKRVQFVKRIGKLLFYREG